MAYEIWHGESGNLVGTYRTKTSALGVVRKALHVHGERYVEGLALLYERGERTEQIAAGAELVKVARALPHAAPKAQVSPPVHRPRGEADPIRGPGRRPAAASKVTGTGSRASR